MLVARTHCERHWIHIIAAIVFMACRSTSHALQPGATVLVTGSTDGIGVTTAKNMAAQGYNVIIHGRDAQRIKRAHRTVLDWVADHSNERPQVWKLPPADLSTLAGARQLAKDAEQVCRTENAALTVIMNNAGVYTSQHVTTEDGLELTFAVNVMAPFVITSLLLPTLLKEPKSRIVVASSISQSGSIRDWNDLNYQEARSYSGHAAYSESKLMDAMLTFEMADRLQAKSLGPDRITANCLDPGTVNTKMLLDGWGPIGIDVDDALGQTYLCTAKEVEGITGNYFIGKNSRKASSTAYKQSERDLLWSILSQLAPDAAKMWHFNWV